MNKTALGLVGILLAGVVSLTGCGGGDGGGGGGGGGQAPVAATTFNTVQLTGLGGDFSTGTAINDDSVAVGFAHNGTSIKGAKWTVTDATPTPVELAPLDGNNYSAAYGINASGVAVGESGTTVDAVADARTVAVYWPAGATTPTPLSLSGLFPEGSSAAFAINDGGTIVGEAVNDADGNTVAVYWATSNAAPVILGNLAGGDFSSAYFIGPDGRIVGEAENNASQTQAVVWLLAVGVGYQAPTALAPVAGQIGSVALGVDGSGKIVGEAELDGGEIQGVIWNVSGSVATTLGANTSAQAINSGNRIVGYRAVDGNDRASIWNGGNVLDNKNLLEIISQAYAVNAKNQAVGFSSNQAVAVVPQ